MVFSRVLNIRTPRFSQFKFIGTLKMSISYSDVNKSELLTKAALYGAKEFVHVKVDLGTGNQNPYPRDYAFPNCFMPKKYSKMGERILNFQVRPDDIWLSTFPKGAIFYI